MFVIIVDILVVFLILFLTSYWLSVSALHVSFFFMPGLPTKAFQIALPGLSYKRVMDISCYFSIPSQPNEFLRALIGIEQMKEQHMGGYR